MSSSNTASPGISVVIPFYKAEAFFPESLATVQRQTHSPAEIIVVNDSPSPESNAFLAQFAPQCKIYSMPVNGGVSAARNAGVKLASHEWIAFLDADDLWEPDKLAKQMAYLAEHPDYSGCHTGIRAFCADKTLAVYVNKSALLSKDELLISSHICPSSFVIKKAVFDSIGGFDTTLRSSEDYDLSIRLVTAGHKIGFLPVALTHLRREQHGNLSSQWQKNLQGHLNLLKKHWDFYWGYGGFNATRRFVGSSYVESGYRCPGLKGKLLVAFGKLLSIGQKLN
jgi:teichuronic acid biosynthesis glycosyltransferase TuaG